MATAPSRRIFTASALASLSSLALASCDSTTDPAPSTPSASGAVPSTNAAADGATATVPIPSGEPLPTATTIVAASESSETGSDAPWVETGSAQAAGDAARLLVTGVRTGTHEDYDRIVVDLSGEGTPGWQAGWVADAGTQGKGDPIQPSGIYILRVFGTGARMPSTAEEIASAQKTLSADLDLPAIASFHYDPTVEAQYQLVLGTSSQSYRIFALSSPTRLVVDVKHP
ncbi:hypothetical protein [Actinomyces gaoshouyii]|uniref:AMIN-like domain-containing protein n=1 Tax=Actinomyces gaoshouyii TaxID=1960083 RepID=A0A8H9LFA8_9ACTO|nr:hypothetical protein [Actinomyces gaoshouyii]GGO99150.1 hypothetical protein GCM10011612_15730 [Actinomyces gaoshouyii]